MKFKRLTFLPLAIISIAMVGFTQAPAHAFWHDYPTASNKALFLVENAEDPLPGSDYGMNDFMDAGIQLFESMYGMKMNLTHETCLVGVIGINEWDLDGSTREWFSDQNILERRAFLNVRSTPSPIMKLESRNENTLFYDYRGPDFHIPKQITDPLDGEISEFDFSILLDKIDSCERPTKEQPGPEDIGEIHYHGLGDLWGATYELKFHNLHGIQRSRFTIGYLGDQTLHTDAWYELRFLLPDGTEIEQPKQRLSDSSGDRERVLRGLRIFGDGRGFGHFLPASELESVVVEVQIYWDGDKNSEAVKLTAWQFADK